MKKNENAMDKVKIEAFAKELNLELGIEIKASVLEQHETLRDFKNYIMQEYYDKLVSKYSGVAVNATPQADDLLTKAIEYIKGLLSTALRMPAEQIETDAAFEKYGIDSIMVMELTSRLEKVFGTLSKTLLFEYRDLGSLSEYLVKNHRSKLQEITGYGASPEIKEPVKAAIEVIDEEKTVKVLRGARFAYSGKETKPTSKRMEIAIVGVSGRYPGARNIEEFWENLSRGKDSITEIPAERWDWKEHFDTDKNKEGKIYSKWGGFIDGVDEFDPLFFNISPREAEYLDPQERIFLECAYKTIEDAGYTKETVGKIKGKGMGSRIGVYAGVMYEEYQLYGAQEQARGRMTALSASPSSIANRVSYVMNFQGPSMAVDTMCSSSLTAIHLACQSIERGECDAAIAGGVNVSVHQNKYLLLSQGKFVSSKGRCESFGRGGDGYVPGEGVGAVLLKPLKDAERDGDHIYGVIRGSMLNAGGKTNGYTVPNPQAQAELIREAMDVAGVKARQVSYIEAHGTGTSLGDPIEIGGLTKAFEKDTEERQYCAIGSVKSNIGHCESAAGIAGVTKVLLQLKHKQIAPSLHSKELNPNIDFKETPFVVQQELGDWKKPDNGPRIAGISSFGAGGANAHLLIEEYQPRVKVEKIAVSKERPALIVLSARDEERLKEKAKDLLKAVESGKYREEDLEDIAYTLQIGREGMEERMGFTAESLKDMEEKLRSYVKGEEKTAKIYKGQIKKNKEALSIITTDEEMREAVEKWIQKRKFEKIVDIWVKGYNFDFMSLYGARKPVRITLPTYPFAREKYWVTITRNTGSSAGRAEVLHPLLQNNNSSFYEQKFSSRFDGSEFFFTDHKVNGNSIFPGAAYLEMARAAIEYATESLNNQNKTVIINNVFWLEPIISNNSGQNVHIALTQDDDGTIEFEVQSHAEDRDIVHFKGFAEIVMDNRSTSQNTLDKVLKSINREITSEACYAEFSRSGIDYGPAHRGIEWIQVGDDESLAKINLPKCIESTLDEYVLHPVILDSAFQSTLGLLSGMSNSQAVVPFSIDRLEIRNSCKQNMWAYVKYSEGKKGLKLDIDLMDDKGVICLHIKGLSLRMLDNRPVSVSRKPERTIDELLSLVQSGELDVSIAHEMLKKQLVNN